MIVKELLRIAVYLGIIFFYLVTELGHIMGVIHLVLVLLNPSKFGMSRLLIYVFDYNYSRLFSK